MYYLTIIITSIIFVLFIGYITSHQINNLYLYAIFWLLYTISVLTLLNIGLNFYITYNTKNKKGISGSRGVKGIQGDKGDDADCDKNCKLDNYNKVVIDNLNKAYNKILEKSRGSIIDPPRKINNEYIIDTIKRICGSKQFKEISQVKHPSNLLDYISNIFIKWIELIADADKSEGKKHFQDYMEIYGERIEWEALVKPNNNPFREIEKYDLYYWGLDKEFHPIKINSCDKDDTKLKSTGVIKAYKTNVYRKVYDDRGTGARRDASIWITEPMKIGGATFFPLGSVSANRHNVQGNNRYIEKFSGNNTDNLKYELSNKSFSGPLHSNIIVSGDRKWIRKPSASSKGWSWKWNDRKTGGRTDVTLWNAEDFTEDGELFRCFGSMAMTNHNRNNPSVQLGRDKVPIVCINNKALEEIPNKNNFVWDDKRSGGRYDGSIFANYDGNYNLSYFQQGYRPDTKRKMYRIKPEFLNTTFTGYTNEINSNIEKEDGLARGFIDVDYKMRDRKKGMFNLLDLVMESNIENFLSKNTFKLEHSGQNNPNSYFIRKINKFTKEPEACLIVNKDKGDIIEEDKCNSTKDNHIWEIEFIGQSRELCLIKSKDNGKYLIDLNNGEYKTLGNIPTRNINNPKFHPFMFKIIT